jgi:hypothetical protein
VITIATEGFVILPYRGKKVVRTFSTPKPPDVHKNQYSRLVPLNARPQNPDTSDELSMHDLLKELSSRGIPFSSTATKRELLRLLRQPDDDYYFETGNTVNKRQQRRERRKSTSSKETSKKEEDESSDYYFIEKEGDYGFNAYDKDKMVSPRERRRRRRREEATSSSFWDSPEGNIPRSVVNVGTKASNIAQRKTKEAFKNLMELTFDEEYEDAAPPRKQKRSPRRQQERYRPRSKYKTKEVSSVRRQPEIDLNPETSTEFVQFRTGDSKNFSNQPPSEMTTTKSPPNEPRQQQERDRPCSNYERKQVSFGRPQPESDLEQEAPSERMQSRSADSKNIPKQPPPEIWRTKAPPKEARNIREILQELDQLGISYAPTASRQELEDLLRGQNYSTTDASPPPSSKTESTDASSTILYYHEENKSEYIIGDDEKATWKGVLKKTPKVAYKKARSIPRRVVKKAEQTAQKAQDMSQQTISSFLEDEDTKKSEKEIAVMDAVIEDYSRDSAIPNEEEDERIVEAEPIPQEEWQARARAKTSTSATTSNPSRHHGFRSKAAQSRRQTTSRRRRPSPRRPQRVRVEEVSPNKYSQKGDDDILRLLPGDEEQPRRHRMRSRSDRQNRRIYSPYGEGSHDDGDGYDYYVDGVDNMGHFVTNTLDSFLWGHDGDSRRYSYRLPKRGKKKGSGHWKDRMEEQFDQILGIHEGGKHYDRWANEELEDDRNATGTDAVSYARGRSSRNKGGGKRIRSRPVWEEEGSLLSVLFGSGEDALRRNSHLYHSSSSLGIVGSNGSILRFSRSLVQSFTVVAGSLGRWASVRGSLPQPLIMVSILSAVLSARPGRRFQSVIIATLALRMIGELLHGYMYDNLDFEDDNDDKPRDEY